MVIETSAKQRSEAFARFFRSRVDTFKAEHPEINSDRAVARLMDMPPGTFDKIMHARTDPGSRQPKTIRRLAKIGITEDEITGCGYIVMGIPSDEREPIFDNARACLEHLVEGNGEHPVTSEDIFYMMAPDIVESYDVPTLLPIIRDAMSTRGFKDPVESDFREILTLDARLKAIRDPEYEETMRHQQIGNLFEEIALLNFQISEDYHVPQYCLTPIRDQESGEVTVTTDIIDFIIMRHGADNFLQKAFAEFAENKGDYLKVDGGKIVITQPGNKRRAARKAGVRSIIRDIDPEARRLRKAIEHEFSGDSKDDLEVRDAFAQAADDMDEAIASSEISERTVYALHFIPDGEEKPFHTQYVTFGVAGIPRSTECGQWVRYLNDDGKYIMIHNLDVAGKLASHWQKAMDGIIKEDPDNDSRQWEMSVPYRAVEVKKAGSSDVRGIVKQLKKQKAAILRHREKAPLSIPGMVSGIDVVVLKSNPNLEEALKDDPFFNYVELRQQHYDESFMPFLSQLEHRTLKEVLLLKRFFSRVNYELSQTPTLRTLEEMYSRLLEEHRHSLGYMASRENEHLRGDELIEAVSNMLAASHLKDEQREKAQAAKQLLDDFARYATPAEVVTEEGLKEVFGKHFDSDYRAKGALNSSMIVHEERDGKLASYSRKFGGKKRKFTSMDERALKLIGKFVDDPEEFYDEDTRSEVKRELGKKLAKRKKARDLADRQEKSFGLKFLECRFSDYTSDMEEMVGDSHGAYTRLESGVISMLRARINGKLPETEIATSEYMLVNGAIQGWRQNYDQLPEHGIERRIVDAINTASKVCDARGGRESSLFEKGRLLGEELYTLMSSVIDKRESFTAKDISEWCSAITEIGIEYSDVLRDHVVGRIDEGSQLALAGRKSIGLDVTACMDIGISDENAGKMFEAMLAKAGIGPEQAAEEGVSANILRAFSPFSREGQQRTVEIRDMFSESVPDAETARESVEKKLGPIIKSQYSEIVSAAITRISMIDEKMLYDRARQMLENTATLAAKTSEHLARDYLSTTAAAVLEFPEVFEDIYISQVKRVKDLLLNDEAAFSAAEGYVNELIHANGRTSDEIKGEFIRRMVVMAVKNNGALDKYLSMIKEGNHAGAMGFEEGYSMPTHEVLKDNYENELNDPHLRYMKMGRVTRKIIEERKAVSKVPLGSGITAKLTQAEEFIEQLNEILDMKRPKREDYQVVKLRVKGEDIENRKSDEAIAREEGLAKKYALEVLSAFKYVNQHHAARVEGMISVFDPKTYKGTKLESKMCGQMFSRTCRQRGVKVTHGKQNPFGAIGYLFDKAPWLVDMYHKDTEGMLEFCGYPGYKRSHLN